MYINVSKAVKIEKAVLSSSLLLSLPESEQQNRSRVGFSTRTVVDLPVFVYMDSEIYLNFWWDPIGSLSTARAYRNHS